MLMIIPLSRQGVYPDTYGHVDRNSVDNQELVFRCRAHWDGSNKAF